MCFLYACNMIYLYGRDARVLIQIKPEEEDRQMKDEKI